MRIHRIFHSGFMVETETATLLFDCFRGEIPKIPADKPLLVFVSHVHSDHYSKSIFELKNAVAPVHYILSADIPQCDEMEGCSCHFLSPNEKLVLNISNKDCTVRTLRSNDAGVAFIVTIGSDKIYHAGDLNNWWWDGDDEDRRLEEQYHEELSKIRGEHFRLAFVPLDPRLSAPHKGIEDFLGFVTVEKLVPMHFSEDFSVVKRFRAMPDFDGIMRGSHLLEVSHGAEVI